MTGIDVTPYANSVFEQPWWLDLVAPGCWDEIVLREADRVVARWPIVHRGNKAFIPKETQTIGIWMARPDGETPAARFSREKRIIEGLMELAPVKYWDYALSPVNDYVLPFKWRGLSIRPAFTYVLANLNDVSRIEASFSKTAKKNIKRASKTVEVREDCGIDPLLDCMRKTFEHQGRSLPVSSDYLEAIAWGAIAHGCGKIMAAYDSKENCHAATLFVYDEHRCYYLLAGTDPEFRTSGAQSLIIRDGIRFAAAHSKVFDFEGSQIEGIEKFFRQFGGTPVPFYSIVRHSVFDAAKTTMKPYLKKMMGYK